MTTKETNNPKQEPFPVWYGHHTYDHADLEHWGMTERVNYLIRQAKAAPRRWDHLLLQVNESTLLLVLTRPFGGMSGDWGVQLVYAAFENDEQKAQAVRQLRREVRKWAKMHRLAPQQIKQLEEV